MSSFLPRFWKDIFAGYRLPGWQCFSCSTSNVATSGLQDSWHHIGWNLQGSPWCVGRDFSLTAFKIFPLSSFSDSLITCVGTHLWFILLVHWALWIYWILAFIRFGEFLAVISSNILSGPFLSQLLLSLPQCAYWPAWCCPTCPLDSGHFFFLFFRYRHFIFLTFKSADSSPWLKYASEPFCFMFCFNYLQLQNCIVIPLTTSVSVLMFPFCPCVIFLACAWLPLALYLFVVL